MCEVFFMNKVFKVIWSEARNAYVVVSEMAKSHGTKSCSTKKLLAMLIATGVMTCASVAPAMAANLAPDDTKIEVGKDAKAKGTDGVAIGKGSEDSAAGWATAIGGDAKATGAYSVALGKDAKSTELQSIAIGNESASSGGSSIAVGTRAKASGGTSIAISQDANASGESSMAFGISSTASDRHTIAIGSIAKALATNAIAIGSQTIADKDNSVAVGPNIQHIGTGAAAVGAQANATGDYSVAMGNLVNVDADWNKNHPGESRKSGSFSVALGSQSGAWGAVSTAVGALSKAEGEQAIAVGALSKAEGEQAIAVGYMSQANVANGTAVGGFSKAEGEYATVLGYAGKASGYCSTALGDFAEANVSKGVALGASSVADRESHVVGLYAPDEDKDSLTWKANAGAVSVGSATITRQITNVAAGSADTDAVNVAQLNAVKAAAGKKVSLVDGENTKAILVKDDATGTQYKVDVDLSKYAKTEDVAVVYDKNKTSLRSTNASVAENAIALGKGASAVKNSIAIGNGAYTQDGTWTSGQSVALGNGAVTGAKSTSIGSNAVGGREGTITIGANANNGSLYATVIGTDSKVNYMTRNSGAAATIVGAKSEIKNDNKSYSGVANGIFGSANTIENSNGVTIQGSGNTVTNAYKDMSGWDFNLGGVYVKKDAGAVGVIGGMNTVSNQIYTNVIGFGNTVAGDADNISHDVFVAGSRNNLSKVSDSIVMGNDNTISDRSNVISFGHQNTISASNAVAIGNGASVSVEGGVALGVGSVADRANAVSVGSKGAERQIINVAAGTADTDAVNVSQLNAVKETANKGWNLSTNGVATEATNVKPGEYVDFSGDDENITVSKEENEYATLVKVNLNRDLNVDSVHAGDFFMNNDMGIGFGGSAYITKNGLNANDKVITNVAAGVYNTDAVNVGQLKKVEEVAANANKGWNLSTNGVATKATNVKPGEYVDFSGDDNIKVSNDGTNVKVELKDELKDIKSIIGAGEGAGSISFADGGIKLNNKVTINKDGKISGVAAGEADTDAVNVSQLKKVSDTANAGWNLSTNGVATKATNVKPGEYVDFSGDKNISVSHDGTKVQVELNKNIDVNSIKTNALNSKYNLSVGTMAENGIMPFLVSSTGAFYAANNNFSVDKDGKVIATAGEIGNVVLQNGVYTGKSALRDGELYLGDASGNYSQITPKSAKLGQVTIDEKGNMAGVNSIQTNALNAKYNLSVGTMAENGIMPFLVSSTGAFYAANNNFSVDKDGKVIATAGEIGNVVLQNGVYTGKSALRDGELYLGDASGNYSQITTTGAKLGQVTIAADGKISGVAAGEVSSTSTDAINGSQLYQTNENVAQNKADIAQNKADIAQNKADIAQNKADIAQNKADIAQNKADIAQNKADIAQNKADIAQNKADIAQNKADIATNKADIATNKADIATNKANIAQNAADIKKVEALAKKHTTVAAGDNITVSDVGPNAEGGKEYKVALNNNITVQSVKAGDTTISDKGLEIKDGPSVTKDGINAGNKKVTGVADGDVKENSKDAINGGQLHQAKADINNRIDGVENQVVSNTNRINQLGNRVNKVGAGAAALAALHPMDFDPDDKLTFSAGYGNYGGENAAAIGAYYRPDEKVMFSVAGTVGNGENMVNAGVSFALDRTNHVSNSRTALAREVIDLRGQLAVMGAKMAKMEKAFGMLDETKTKLFPDVPANHWAYEYIAKLAGNGYIEGYPDGNFGGDRLMTRYEFAAMLYRAIENGAALEEKIIKEFEPELGRIRVDRISGEDGDRDKIERVRVNDTKGERDHYGNKLAK